MMSRGDIETERLILRLLPVDALAATADGNTGEAARLLGCAVPTEWGEVKPLAIMRLEQLGEDPDYQLWSIRAVILRANNVAVGYVNFHARPAQHPQFSEASNMAEIGYTIFEPWRRRGFAREALAALLHFAFENGATQAVLSIAPDNTASLRLAARFGFRKVGTQIDEIDGPEDVFLLPLSNLGR
jgi:RimJ/RimL family protein N-acetyltransferase